ncbi:MAG: TonB-dependent siderophore receptor [OM182 bacterium]|nr:MAG: TonB-dependent siderophore receptor [OM182 bacterium]
MSVHVNFSRLLAPLLVALVLVCPLAFADSAQSDAQANDVVETVVVIGEYLYSDQVNALKTPTPVIDVPQSLSIVTSDQIAKQGFTSIGDIITYLPGTNTSQGEGHRDAVVFRGMRSTADFYIDGARDDVQYYRPLYNLEQVEVLRGPNALFFGRGGTGGILNRVTKKSSVGENFSRFRASADSFGEYDLQVDGNFTTSENVAVRLNAFYESLENHRDHYDGGRLGLNPTAKILLTDATTLDLSYEYIDHERFIDRGIPTGSDGRPVEAFEEIVFGDPTLNTTTLQAHLLRATLAHNFSDSLKGNVSVFYADYDKLYQNFYASAYDQAATPDQVTLDGYLDTTQRQNAMLSSNLIQELYTGALAHTLILGLEYIDTSSDQDRFNAFWDTNSDDTEIFSTARPLGLVGGSGINASGVTTTNSFAADLNDDTRVGIEVFSAYIQDEIAVLNQLDIILGARFDSFEIDVLNVIADEARSRTDSEISPRFGVVYKPDEDISIYASYSESFLPRSGEQFANINAPNDALDPDSFTNIEIGLKWNVAQGLNLTLAAFEIEQSSPQAADDDPSTLDVIDSEITGFEAQLQGRVSDKWFLSAGYSYLDGEVVDLSGPTGRTPRELPSDMLSLWNNYQVTDNLGLGLGLTYQGKSYINSSNSAMLPSFTRIDMAVYYSVSDKLTVQLNVENLTDQLYFPNAHSTHQATVGAPLNARLTVSRQL